MSYTVNGPPQLTNGVTTFDLGEVMQIDQRQGPIQKIIITEKLTERVIEKLKDPELKERLREKEHLKEFKDSINYEYNEIIYDNNKTVDECNKLHA